MSARPGFIIAGTSPAGTGQLYVLMQQHPEIYLPKNMAPECNFFLKTRDYEKGISYYLENFYQDVSSEKAQGERSSMLISGAHVPDRIFKHYPDMKLIFLLRNPVERAYAHYRFTVLAGFEELSFEEALEKEESRIANEKNLFWQEVQRYSYFKRGLFYEELNRFYAVFPKENILVHRSDILKSDRKSFLKALFSFLGVTADFEPDDASDFPSPGVKDRKLQADLRRRFPSDFDASIQKIREGSPLTSECDQLMSQNLTDQKPPLDPQTRKTLLERYRKPNEELKSLIDFSIEDWFS